MASDLREMLGRRLYLTVFLATALVYLLTSHIASGQISDTQAVIAPAYNFVHHGTFFLDHARGLPANNEWFWHVNGHLVSARMMGPVLAGVPLCALLAWTPLSPGALNALNAALLTALAMTFLLAALRRMVPDRLALTGYAVVAFGTSVWTVAAAETWPQTVDVLFLALMLLALSRRRVGWAGIALAPALLSRPHLAVVALVMGVGLAATRRSWRPLLGFGIPAVGAFGLLYVWNHAIYGRWQLLGTYSDKLTSVPAGSGGGRSYLANVAGALVTPTQGLLVLSPLLALALVWLLRHPGSAPAWSRLAMLAGLLYEAIQLRLDVYTGGGGFFGSRLTLELVLLAAPMAVTTYHPWATGHPGRRYVTSLAAAWSVAIFATGALLKDYLIGGDSSLDWTSYYPARVIGFAGRTGAMVTMLLTLALLAFAGFRYRTLFVTRSPLPAGELPAPRSAADDVTPVGTEMSRA